MDDEQLFRIAAAGIVFTDTQAKEYTTAEDDLGEVVKGSEVPLGYKRCGRCGCGKKFFLFNKNAGSKTNTSGNCKDCQKGTASKSYAKTKSKRNYKKYYQENKEMKQEHARKYYTENKDRLKETHKAYLATNKGKRVMKKAHSKRRQALATNKGIVYTRAMVIERDSTFIGHELPLCYLCLKRIDDTSGASLHLDHVVPVVTGGLDCFTNIACTHNDCNLRREKDARLLTSEQVETIIERAEAYIDEHPEQFE